ncbi:MAG TPA: FAD-binding oxidoreductase [Blastocatellia bacterium]|nr:FAD-binding oxidoreductase [Blastocatellia bacterium]
MTSANLRPRFESITGAEHVSAADGLTIDQQRPGLIVRPGSSDEVGACMRICGEGGVAVVPAGLMNWLECGNTLRRADVVISLSRMNRIIEYAPADLIAIVEGGVTIGQLYETTAVQRQWLPLDPPGGPDSSVGAIAACASNGPLRFGFGTPRDYVIGLRLAHINGEISKCGGKVVKNVAGYDMNKAYVGSFGTLAILTEVTFKLRPLPERSATVVLTSTSPEDLLRAASGILTSELRPSSLFLTSGFSRWFDSGPVRSTVLLLRFLESNEAVEYQIGRTRVISSGCHASELVEADASAAWSRVANVDREASTCFTLSLPISRAAEYALRLAGEVPKPVVAADLGAGIIRMAFDVDDRRGAELADCWRREVSSFGGTLTIDRAPLEVRRRVGAWNDPGPAAVIMQRIKSSFDPDSLLSPGRFVAGL